MLYSRLGLHIDVEKVDIPCLSVRFSHKCFSPSTIMLIGTVGDTAILIFAKSFFPEQVDIFEMATS